MTLRMEPGQTYNTWDEFKAALDAHCRENKVLFNTSNAKTVEQANLTIKKKPFYDAKLKYVHVVLQCKHYGSYTSQSVGLRPKQRSYKINCKAFISLSACRKENYLIIRDSYHIHSHPCTEEIYNSYPEVRRMTKDERRMVGTLMEMGVSVSQIKSAVGRHVTPKDIHNAKNHVKAVKMGLKSEENKKRHRRTFQEMEADQSREEQEELESGVEAIEGSSTSSSECKRAKLEADEDSRSREEETVQEASTSAVVESEMPMEEESMSMVECQTSSEDGMGDGSLTGLSGLLAAAGLGKGNGQDENSSYTVTVSMPDGEVTHTGCNLQELLKGLPLNKLIPAKSSTESEVSNVVKTEPESEGPPMEQRKNCEQCASYMSPLDGHSLCLSCLGPVHLHRNDCVHCMAMKPEQLNIRRKLLVRMRMKALKSLKVKKDEVSQFSQGPPYDSDDSTTSVGQRRSKRGHKPKTFGSDISVENAFVQGLSSVKSSKRSGKLSAVTKCVVSDGDKNYVVEIPKREPLDDYDSSYYTFNSRDDGYHDGVQKLNTQTQNSARFNHLLNQSTVLEGVSLSHCLNGAVGYVPDVSTCTEFSRLMSSKNPSSVPPFFLAKYNLDQQFESEFCSAPPPLDNVVDPAVEALGSGLQKLVKNATVNTRLAVYDKLFTKLGVGMADEALTILTELYGKVTHVTEISQEDLTNDLQTALDTIQALKDLLEELGIMSKDAVTTAAHQRSLSLGSLDAARKSLKRRNAFSSDESTTRRGKFKPFSQSNTSPQTPPVVQRPLTPQPPTTVIEASSLTSPSSQELKQLVMGVSHAEQAEMIQSNTPIMAIATSQDFEVQGENTTTSFISVANKDFAVAPMAVSGELLESLGHPKDGIIELHVMKDESELLTSASTEGTVEEVIQ